MGYDKTVQEAICAVRAFLKRQPAWADAGAVFEAAEEHACNRIRFERHTCDGEAVLLCIFVPKDVVPEITPRLAQSMRLSPTQARVAELLMQQKTTREIATIRQISFHTARRHIEAILVRLNVRTRREVNTAVISASLDSVD